MKKFSKRTILFIYISIVLCCFLLSCLLIFAQPIRVVGNSMSPSYQHNNLVFVNTAAKNYSKNNVIILRYGKEKIIKRICAEQGDTVEIRADGIYINQVFITDNNEYKEMQYFLRENEYFVLGDNYDQSTDSRYFGIISENQILGKVIN